MSALLLDTVLGAIAVILVAAPNTATGDVVAAAVLATAIGTVFAVLSVLAVQSVAAPVRQRNELRREARQALHAAPGPEELAARRQQEERNRTLRVAVAQISEELELNASVLERDDRSFFAEHELAVARWKDHGSALADYGYTDAHRIVRHAYRLIDDVNRSIDHEYGSARGAVQVVEATVDEQAAREALDACRQALAELLRVVPRG